MLVQNWKRDPDVSAPGTLIPRSCKQAKVDCFNREGVSMSAIPGGRSGRFLVVALVVLVGGLIAIAALGAIGQWVALSLASGTLRPTFLLALVPFAVWSYGLRVIRWHTLVARLTPGLPLKVSAHSQVVGFAFSATPGRVAELYKLKLLERSANLPVARSLPAAVVERLTDVAAFGLLAVVGGLFNWSGLGTEGHTTWWAILGIGLIIVAAVYHLGRRHVDWGARLTALRDIWRDHGARYARFLPGAGRLSAMLAQVHAGGAMVSGPSTLTFAVACVVLGRLGDSVILYQIAQAVGYPMPYTMALLMIGSAGLAGGITFSPGGLGATEATLVGLIMARGAPLGAAMVAAFGARALIYWLWVLLGLLVFVVSHRKHITGWTGLRTQDGVLSKE